MKLPRTRAAKIREMVRRLGCTPGEAAAVLAAEAGEQVDLVACDDAGRPLPKPPARPPSPFDDDPPTAA